MSANKWDMRLLGLAWHISAWSKDPSTKVGAVIADEKHRIVSVGFNGLPRGIPDEAEYLDDRQTKYGSILHAEDNAITFAQRDLSGCSMYVYPLAPCSNCAARIVQTGIVRVVAPTSPKYLDNRWHDSLELAKRIYGDRVTLTEIRGDLLSTLRRG